jgi:hypothetical protein
MQRIDASVNQPLMAEFRLMRREKRDPPDAMASD